MLDERHANRSAIRARLYTLFLDRKRLFEKAACAKSYNKVRYVKLLGFFDHTAAGEGDILSSIEFGRRVLTWASIVVFLSLLGTFWVWIPSWRHFSRLSGLLVLLPFLLPYGFIPLRLNSRRFQSGLTLAIAMGCALVVPGVYLIRFVLRWEKNWWILGNLILALLMQPVLVVIATKTFIAMPHPPRWRIKLLGSLAYGVLLCGLFLVSYSPVPRYLSDNENSALGNLFHCALSFHIANMTPNADPPCKVPCGWVVAPQKTSDGYFFEYVAISSPMTTEGCRRFKSFAMTARPLTYGRTGIRSFLVDLVDESIVVHATSENRPANASDPIVWTEDDYFSRRVPP